MTIIMAQKSVFARTISILCLITFIFLCDYATFVASQLSQQEQAFIRGALGQPKSSMKSWRNVRDSSSTSSSSSPCQVLKMVELVKHPGCNPKAVTAFACSGSCPSYVQVSSSNSVWQHERQCSCCQQTRVRESTIVLDCPSLDPPYKDVRRFEPIDCMCRTCDDIGKEELLIPQELIEAGVLDAMGKSIARNRF